MGTTASQQELLRERARARSADLEHERRYVLSADEASRFLDAVEPFVALDVYDPDRPIAYTRTTYLDTEDLEYLRSSEGPVARRLRVREYAAAATAEATPLLTGLCFLELKEVMGRMRTKVRLAAPAEVLGRVIAQPEELRRVGDARADALRLLEARLRGCRIRPQVTTLYRRASYADAAGLTRITLDQALAYYLPRAPGAAGEPACRFEPFAHGPARVLEVKHHGAPPRWLAGALGGLEERSGFSKFRAAMTALAAAREAPCHAHAASGSAAAAGSVGP